MRDIYIDKVVVPHGRRRSRGQARERREHHESDHQADTDPEQLPKKTQPAFSVRKGMPIGCKVTLRGKPARDFIATALTIVQKTIFESQFDKSGNFAFGIEEHTDFPGMSYDPQIGIYGMDVTFVPRAQRYPDHPPGMAQKKLPQNSGVNKNGCDSVPQRKVPGRGALMAEKGRRSTVACERMQDVRA